MVVIYSDAMGEGQVEKILHLLCAFPVVLQDHVQGFRSPALIAEYLTEEDRVDIERVTNRPLFLVNKLAHQLRCISDSATFTSRERNQLMKYVDDVCSSIGACERIVQTPVPLTYARHTSRFLSLFCMSMPYALVSEVGAHIIPFVTFVTWALFGIQEIGMMIEEPFQRALKLEVFGKFFAVSKIELAGLLS
jgi:predicted membrane chloride channel (bestrophin family)